MNFSLGNRTDVSHHHFLGDKSSPSHHVGLGIRTEHRLGKKATPQIFREEIYNTHNDVEDNAPKTFQYKQVTKVQHQPRSHLEKPKKEHKNSKDVKFA